MSVFYEDATVTVHHGDCLDVLRTLPDASVDAVVTDPPYDLTNRTPDVKGCTSCGRTLGGSDGNPDVCPRCGGELTRQRSAQGKGFMGKAWDGTGVAFRPAVWIECLRVLKPGGHLLAFGGTRTSHRLACAVEDAGFEIRDSIAWLYGSGFPKSLDVSKAIDKAAGAEREVVGSRILRGRAAQSTQDKGGTYTAGAPSSAGLTKVEEFTAPATDDARTWQGWGTALKPAFEPVVVARKPLIGTIAANVLAHGTGALNIDATRIGVSEWDDAVNLCATSTRTSSTTGLRTCNSCGEPTTTPTTTSGSRSGRWPANVVLDESQADALDEQSGTLTSGLMRAGTKPKGERETYGQDAAGGYKTAQDTPGDSGGASRFFYVAKADASERVCIDGTAHPTVKPLALMRWLVRLVTPLGGTVLEPFAGSGTTVEACILEGFSCIAIEREVDYLPLIHQRIHRRRDPVVAVKASGVDAGLFDLFDGGVA